MNVNQGWFRSIEPVDPTEVERSLDLLRKSIVQIQNGDTSQLSFEELYRTSYSLVLHKHGAKLYQIVRDTISDHLRSVVAIISEFSGSDGDFLKLIESGWNANQVAMAMIRDVLMYMDKNFVSASALLCTVDLGSSLFQKIVLLHFSDRLIAATLDLIDSSRTSVAPYPSSIIGILVDSDIVGSLFMSEFLKRTETFYTKQVSDDFIIWALSSIETELAHPELACADLKTVLYRSIILPSFPVVLVPNFFVVSTSSLVQSGLKLYLQTAESSAHLLNLFASDLALAIRNETSIVGLISVHSHFAAIVKLSDVLQPTMKSVFEELLNEPSLNIGRQLAQFLDDTMRKEEPLSLSLFRYIHSKDVFEFYGRSLLSRRLLSGRFDLLAERQLLALLRTECGSEYTSKMEAMVADVERTSGWTVCTTGVWPGMKVIPNVLLPEQLKGQILKFEKEYGARFSGRKLTWVFTQGWAEVAASFGDARYTLCVSTVQMLVLLNWTTGTLSSLDLAKFTGIEESELRRHLLSLVRANILTENGKCYAINEQYESKTRYVRVPQVLDKLVVAANDSAEILVDEDRKHLIEASLVRIMKTQRQLDHARIVVAVKQIIGNRFAPSIAMIDGRINNLIEREFIAKDNDDLTLFYYVA